MSELSHCATDEERTNKLCEINVIDQVHRLLSSDVLAHARNKGIRVFVYGLIYDLRDGLLQELDTPHEVA